MRRLVLFRFPVFACLLLLLWIGYAQEASAQAREPTTMHLIIREGNTVSEMCTALARLRGLPGTVSECVRDAAARNDISDMRRIPAGSTLAFSVVTLPGDTTVGTSGGANARLEELLQEANARIEALTLRLNEVLRTSGATIDVRPYWLAIGLLALLAIAALAALAMSERRRVRIVREHTTTVRTLETQRQEAEDAYFALCREHEEVIKVMAERSERREFAPVPIILKAPFVGDGELPPEDRTFYVHITGASVREGEMVLFCKLPWGAYLRYNKRRIEREFYEHEDELESLCGYTISFPDNMRNYSYLFEKGPPDVHEILDGSGFTSSAEERSALH